MRTEQVKGFRDLEVWQRAMNLVEEVYRLTKELPKQEIYGLTAQMQRAAVSIPSNIAEGNGRGSTREYIYFTSVALGSIAELQTQLLLAERLKYLTADSISLLITECDTISRMLRALQSSLKRRLNSSSSPPQP